MMKVHFLNVGHGECTIIEHPSGRLTMVDINTSKEYDWETLQEYIEEKRNRSPLSSGLFGMPPNPATGLLVGVAGGFGGLTDALFEISARQEANKEVTDPIAFLQANYPNRPLFRFILTHPDLDHMRGIKRLYETVGFANFWDVAHTKPTPTFKSDGDKEDWTFYQRLRYGAFGLWPKQYYRGHQLFAFARDENGMLGGDCIEILSPTPALVQSCNVAEKSNDLSYVLRVAHENRSVLLTGDIEDEAWDDLVRTYGVGLKSDFMAASHHGRDSGYHPPALRLINPHSVVVSVGRKPSTDASRKYSLNCSNVHSTRYYGNLELQIRNDGSCQWFSQRIGS
jgi:competence protein ComEC